MKTLLLNLVLLGGLSMSLLSAQDPTKITYKTVGDVDLRLNVFNPPAHTAESNAPAIVFFFGGGWVNGAPNQFFPHSRLLSSKGMVAIVAEYRVRNTHGTTPQECVKDAKSAMRYVRAHAAELGIDPDKIAGGGGSAGGHLAAACATLDGFNEEGEPTEVSCRPDLLILFNPVADNSPNGYGHERVEDYWEVFSPMHNLDEDTPPTIIFLGTEDTLIPVATMEAYQQKMEELGIRCELHLYDGEGHGFFNYGRDESRGYNLTMPEVVRFLAEYNYIPEAPGEISSTPKRAFR